LFKLKAFKPSTSVKSRLIISIALILLVPSFAITAISYKTAVSQVDSQMQNTSQQSVQLVNRLIDHYIASYEYELEVLNEEINAKDMTAVQQAIDRYQSVHPELANVLLGKNDGTYLVAPKTKFPDDFDARKRPWYSLAMDHPGKMTITSPYVSPVTGHMIITFAKTTNDGQGVITSTLDLQNLSAIVQDVQIGKKGYVIIIDQDKNYLVSPLNKAGTKATSPEIEAMFKAPSGKLSYTLEGQNKWMVFATNPTTGWKIGGTWYAKEAVSDASPILKMTGIVLIVSLLLGGILVYFIINSIVKPLQVLMHASRTIKEGDLTKPIHIRSKDEFGRLGESFNAMRESLRSVILEVGNASDQVATSAEQLTASAGQTSQATQHIAEMVEEVAAGSEQQVRSVEDGSRVIKDLSSGIQQVAANSQAVTLTASRTTHVAEEGQQLLKTVIEQMNEIHSAVHGLSQAMERLTHSSGQIGSIVNVITEISSQTNLLSLNAAIEAARAGEQGRGFAVVANEVRSLAEQSSQSAKKIGELIQTIQNDTSQAFELSTSVTKEVQNGLQAVNTVELSFNHIQQAINEVAEQIEHVSAAVQHMSSNSERIVHSMDTIVDVAGTAASMTQNMSAAAEEQLASMEQISASAQSLAKMAEEMQDLARKFKVS
jgi:methyl-accepting chemotaxis protein